MKNALLDYIKKNHPNDPEKIDMLSMRFGMHREVGEQFEETGERQIHAICGRFSGSFSIISASPSHFEMRVFSSERHRLKGIDDRDSARGDREL